ncbi:AAA family ATPase [Burkholderia sp. 22PA0106]|uniref:AAA family ATPase n=1 Tax=Burkholderia sp. 22PA0106 TaxID=3237371 RepID=UPI0039C40B2B
MPTVQTLTITGYKSIRELHDFELRNLNVLIGANGAGKSNFIGFFRLLAEIAEQRLQVFVQKQGGPDTLLHYSRQVTDRIYADIQFGDGNYTFFLIPTNDNRLIFEREFASVTDERGKPNFSLAFLDGNAESHLTESRNQHTANTGASLIATIKSWRIYHFQDTSETAKVKQPHARNDTLRLKVDSANLAAYLHMLRTKHASHYRLIVETIRLIAPFFSDFVHRDDDAATIELEWTEQGNPDTPFKAHMLSDGTLRFICLATLLLQPHELMPSTILIDEPELGLHPYAISVLADMLKRASENIQLIVSTQSVELLNCLDPEDVVIVDRKDNASTFTRLDADALQSWLDDYSLGDLWKQNVLGGRPA